MLNLAASEGDERGGGTSARPWRREMYGSRTPIDLQRSLEGNDVYARLNWLISVNAQEERRRSMSKHAAEEDELLLMRRPMDTRRAYALFGLMLGLFPPAAIFIKIFGYGLGV